ncbi:hypothetical protein N7492_005800 [Penicillium capsulatum]|uniref:Zn(2)-C6 fungal-type domain-containing protein n=1 Tax=Penicillium capsulatum TaxID=69766 RepID=A0A9W9IGH2_9EURO|nr:hypothetical protein N7492_005800 [Penicillium capsulatum]KAJ6135100.1 hypothetical protein N7512_000260 [Penicillium capsulatum]
MSDHLDPTLSADRQPAPRSSAPRVRLSCDACRQRKVKCDKLSPCTSCQRLGFKCVPVERARLPRGRTRRAPERANGSDKELADRVAKLEHLLKRVADGGASRSANEEDASPSLLPSTENSTEHNFETKMADVASWRDGHVQPTMTLPHRPRPNTAYMASSFWEDIMQQTQELRSVLDDRVENDQTEYRSLPGVGSSLIGSESPSSQSMSASPQSAKAFNLPTHTRRNLAEIYIANVDPIFKLLHRPSLRAFLVEDKPYLDYEPDHPAPATLALAVYCTAICTIDDAQCQLLFDTDKKTALLDLQRELEAALVKVDFVTTTDLTVLQAYLLSLLASRCLDQSRRVWTMLSMALRVAQALGLHKPEPPFHVSPFDQEMRRRCWLCIAILDVSTSQDRASEPMMQAAWLKSHPPSNINDEDMWFDMEGPIQRPPAGTFTDMTHPLILAEGQFTSRSITFSDFSEQSVKSMTQRQQVVNDFQKAVCDLSRGGRPETYAFHRYSYKVAVIINSWFQLGCLRPTQRSPNFVPPPVQGDVLLRLAVNNMQNALELSNDPQTAPWRWFGLMWVPWHALAVALAELCVCKDAATMTQYWPLVEQVFHNSSLTIADSQHGMLWRPLEKLMTQARARKRELLGSVSPGAALQTSSSTASPPAPLGNAPIQPPPRQTTVPSQPDPTFPLGLETTMAAGQPVNPALAMPPSFSFEAYPNVWDAMDFNNPGLDYQGDNAWLNYDSFMGDVYDSVDSMFLPR